MDNYWEVGRPGAVLHFLIMEPNGSNLPFKVSAVIFQQPNNKESSLKHYRQEMFFLKGNLADLKFLLSKKSKAKISRLPNKTLLISRRQCFKQHIKKGCWKNFLADSNAMFKSHRVFKQNPLLAFKPLMRTDGFSNSPFNEEKKREQRGFEIRNVLILTPRTTNILQRSLVGSKKNFFIRITK